MGLRVRQLALCRSGVKGYKSVQALQRFDAPCVEMQVWIVARTSVHLALKAFDRLCKNPRRVPQELLTEMTGTNSVCAKLKFFNDWFYSNKDITRVVLIHRARRPRKKDLRHLRVASLDQSSTKS